MNNHHSRLDWKSESGQVIMLVTVAMMSLLAFVGLVLDIGVQLEQRRQFQNAVDAAVHAGAQMLPDTAAASTHAEQYFNANRPSLGVTALTISFPSTDNERIEVEASTELKYSFLSLFGKKSTTVSARAVAGAQATDVMIALDRSGSMCQDSHGLKLNCPASAPAHQPMTSVKAAANGFGTLFEPGYARMGLVSFSTDATLDQVISTDFGAGSGLETAVNDIYPSGRTNIGDAIAEAIDEVMNGSATRQDALKVIVLLSDGVPNRCAGGSSCTDYAAANYARDQAQAAAALGITIYAIGLGTNLDEVLMQDIADLGNGVYIQSPTAADLDGTFDAIAGLIKVRILE